MKNGDQLASGWHQKSMPTSKGHFFKKPCFSFGKTMILKVLEIEVGRKNRSKIHQKSIKNQQNINQKSIKIGPWRGKGAIWEGPGAHLGPKRPPDPSRCRVEQIRKKHFGSQNPRKSSPKSFKIGKKINPESYQFFH